MKNKLEMLGVWQFVAILILGITMVCMHTMYGTTPLNSIVGLTAYYLTAIWLCFTGLKLMRYAMQLPMELLDDAVTKLEDLFKPSQKYNTQNDATPSHGATRRKHPTIDPVGYPPEVKHYPMFNFEDPVDRIGIVESMAKDAATAIAAHAEKEFLGDDPNSRAPTDAEIEKALIMAVNRAFGSGWQLRPHPQSNLKYRILFLPGDKSNEYQEPTRMIRIRWKGEYILVPHWLDRRLNEIVIEKDQVNV